ncbi:Phospholipase/lecithinase/hemolysin [Singulisphaera sp. GP187]|uniref:SGNH/GDSL hydrolase family protein n=1 Tax=Singulisphaera sp. GP187 TaxID=1882752 RepID=UPI00092B83EB|nr:SGNH/GDSL hydrolase family protein [Singulisphaera sp. GP187]SIO03419.1 Phospholipase/lecithinase/hemolysin [Singulisphaera sp. GP187]
MRGLKEGILASILALMPGSAVPAGEFTGIGVLGDSYSDEYQFYSPDRMSSRNWVEILAATRGLNFGQFSTISRGQPRNQGYEFNWAQSDATTVDLLAAGQHTGLATQVAAGEVSLVVIFVGGNDFIHALVSANPATALGEVLPRALANYRVALETILNANRQVNVVAVTVPDIRDLPMIRGAVRDRGLSVELLDRYSAALNAYNTQIRSLALIQPRVAVADFDVAAKIANRFSRDHALIGGRRLDRLQSGNDLHHLFLADQRHFGTMGQGLMAQMVVNAIDTKFAATVAPLSDRDIAGFAASLSEPTANPASLATLGAKGTRAESRPTEGR